MNNIVNIIRELWRVRVRGRRRVIYHYSESENKLISKVRDNVRERERERKRERERTREVGRDNSIFVLRLPPK